ncbi:hypothetical protein L1887_11561 [Cichorium endivia]|nr:hypothetical protein L1887_11561 [Cichorium endivia]
MMWRLFDFNVNVVIMAPISFHRVLYQRFEFPWLISELVTGLILLIFHKIHKASKRRKSIWCTLQIDKPFIDEKNLMDGLAFFMLMGLEGEGPGDGNLNFLPHYLSMSVMHEIGLRCGFKRGRVVVPHLRKIYADNTTAASSFRPLPLNNVWLSPLLLLTSATSAPYSPQLHPPPAHLCCCSLYSASHGATTTHSPLLLTLLLRQGKTYPFIKFSHVVDVYLAEKKNFYRKNIQNRRDFSMGKVGTLTSKRKWINEEVTITANGDSFILGVVEYTDDWSPFKTEEDFLADVDEDDGISDTWMQEYGNELDEGEFRPENQIDNHESANQESAIGSRNTGDTGGVTSVPTAPTPPEEDSTVESRNTGDAGGDTSILATPMSLEEDSTVESRTRGDASGVTSVPATPILSEEDSTVEYRNRGDVGVVTGIPATPTPPKEDLRRVELDAEINAVDENFNLITKQIAMNLQLNPGTRVTLFRPKNQTDNHESAVESRNTSDAGGVTSVLATLTPSEEDSTGVELEAETNAVDKSFNLRTKQITMNLRSNPRT